MESTMEHKVIIVMSPMGFVIGRMDEGKLTSPRILSISHGDKPGVLSVHFKNIVGDPSIFYIGNTPHYESEDGELNDLYTEAISGIVRSAVIQ